MRRFSIPVIALILSCLGVSADTSSPAVFNSFGTILQDFDTLSSTTASATTPLGWGFAEGGTNANTTYSVGTGSGNAGDTYSFGAAASTERALGGLQSGSLLPTLGARFQNNTGGTITSLAISYTGEQWRLGALNRADRIDFQYSTSASSLLVGTYADFDALDFVAPVSTGVVGALNGNVAPNRTALSGNITGLNIPQGATFWIRWSSVDAAGADDGLAIDDFSITADGFIPTGDDPPAVITTSPAAAASGVAVDSNVVINFSESVAAVESAFSIACPGAQAFTLSGSGSLALTLDPVADLPYSSTCTVTVDKTGITDSDLNDPPDNPLTNTVFSFTTGAPPSNATIVISQVYGGGGNSGATFTNDYVELYNRGNVTVNTDGWSIQYASATGSGWGSQRTPLGGPIAPGQYYLVKLASGGAAGAAVPAENVSGATNISATQGKIALVRSFTALSGNCPATDPNLEDFVGYGAADCSEGPTRAPAPGNASAIFRLGGGLIDSDRNGSDFVTGVPAPRRDAPIVELGPVVVSTEPIPGGVNVPRDPTIVIQFREPVDVDPSWFDITCAVSGSHNSHTLAGDGRFFDITPNVNMVAGESCTVTVFADRVHDQDLDDSGPNTDTMVGDYSWSFSVASGTAPPYPADVHLTMGNPSGAAANIGQPLNYLMEKPEYALSYNRDLGRPNWVSWHLSPEWYGTLTRNDTFRADPQVPPEWYRVQGFDFSGSGFDRGHMVPNADRDKETSIPINQATYLMTNMLAQAPGNNQGPWADLEIYLRTLTDSGRELYIVAGPEGIGGTGSQGGVTMTIAGGHVAVPAKTWKAVLVLDADQGDDVSRATCSTRTIAVIMPNDHGIGEDDWENYLTSVDAVESLTGYDLFSSLPDDVEYCVEAGINGVNPPPDITPPMIAVANPIAGAEYLLNEIVFASYSCVDTGSGLGSCVGTTADGAAIDTSSAGAHTFSVTGTDRLGNTSTVDVAYLVLGPVDVLDRIAAELRALIASSRPPVSNRLATALRKVEEAMAELSETPPDTHQAAISIRQAAQQIEGLRDQGRLSADVANALLARLATVSL